MVPDSTEPNNWFYESFTFLAKSLRGWAIAAEIVGSDPV
jgi:hypothetical protein